MKGRVNSVPEFSVANRRPNPGDTACSSRPAKIGDASTGRETRTTLPVIPFDRDAARAYAAIRRDRAIRAPDAIQLACAAHARVDLFITNDDRLTRYAVPGIQFIAPLDGAFL
jgi:predicted nucleic acid-binding protein